MWTKLGLALLTLALVAASWAYRAKIADTVAPLPTRPQLACAKEDCIMTIEPCRRDPVSGWDDSLYAAAKAPGVELRPCRATTELAFGE